MLEFFKGYICGVMLATYFGPISILCIKKTIEKGFNAGVSVGLGASLGDFTYIVVVGIGLAIIPDNVVEFVEPIGSVVVILMGIRELYNSKKPIVSPEEDSDKKQTLKSNLKLGLIPYFLVISNPINMAIFITILSVAAQDSFEYIDIILVASGVSSGSITYWCLFVILISKIKHFISNKFLNKARIITSISIISFGCYTLLT